MDNLEVLEDVAVNYVAFLAGLIGQASAAPPTLGPVLDFGAGVGTYAKMARRSGFDVTCAELDPGLRRRLAEDGFATTADVAAIEDGRFAFTYSFNVLEHIDDDLGALEELLRVTAPGGRLLLYVPAFPLLYSRMDARVGHLRRYRGPALADLVTRSGFCVQSWSYADSLGFPASLAYRLFGGGDLDRWSVGLYDRWAFPLSRRLDTAAERLFGKNVVLWAGRPDNGP
ncbi:MAG: class I SAM-dependent methyltransferase [Acidimicrobiales bacterium]